MFASEQALTTTVIMESEGDGQNQVAETDEIGAGDNAFDGALQNILNEFNDEDERDNREENPIDDQFQYNQKQIWPSEDEDEGTENELNLELEDRYINNVEEFNPELEHEVDETEHELVIGPGMLLSKESLEELGRPSVCLITPEDVRNEEEETECKRKIQEEICSSNKTIRELAGK